MRVRMRMCDQFAQDAMRALYLPEMRVRLCFMSENKQLARARVATKSYASILPRYLMST